jgi:CRP-like cAMP-binding protein
MHPLPASGDGSVNRLLAALPEREREWLAPGWERVRLDFAQRLYDRDARLTHIHFPLSGMVSLVNSMEDGSTVEVATVGREGMLGVPMLLQSEAWAVTDAVCQVSGEALRMPLVRFQEHLHESRRLLDLVQQFSGALFHLAAQNVACNRLHSTRQRLCRWLLMTHDRMDDDEFPLTQEFLSHMLGTRRASVSVAAQSLQDVELIRYHRGLITVLDRTRLERCACECYRVIHEIFDRLYR